MVVEKFLDPKNDFAFKKIFGTEKHKNILIHFLNNMLDFKEGNKISEVQFLRTTQDPEIASKKQSIVDVLCKDQRGCQYIVEMQVAHTPGFEKRAQFYAAKAYANQMKQGEAYHELKEIIFLAITDFVMFPEKTGYRSTHVTLDAEALTRDLKDFYFSFLELPKFTKTVDQLETLVDKWAFFFKHASHTTPEELDKLTDSDLIFKEAYQALDQFYWTEEELNTYEQELKRTRDAKAILESKLNTAEATGLAKGLAKGLAEGLAKGKAEGLAEGKKNAMLEVAQIMLSKNVSTQDIKAITNLSDTEITQLIPFKDLKLTQIALKDKELKKQ